MMSGTMPSDVDGGDNATMEHRATSAFLSSNKRLAGAGMTPPGNDDDSDIGPSFTGGHISDPLP